MFRRFGIGFAETQVILAFMGGALLAFALVYSGHIDDAFESLGTLAKENIESGS